MNNILMTFQSRLAKVNLPNFHKSLQGFLRSHNFLLFTTSSFQKSNARMRILFLLGFSCPFTSDTSPKWTDRERRGKHRTGTRQIHLEDRAVSHRFDGMLPRKYTTSWFCYIHKKETLHTLRTGHARGTRALFFPVPILLTGTCFADYFDANNN